MNEFEVTCIRKPHPENRHEHITHIGSQEQKWLLTRELVIKEIDGKTSAFYTIDKSTGRRAYIEVVREPGKATYLRTRADGKLNDNLLELPTCGADCTLKG